jgi:tRNA(Ile)-lysidine synthase
MAEATLEQALRHWSGEPLLLGLSGGLDSTVLLHALAAIPAVRATGLRVVHVDHGLHRQAADWARHCQALVTGLGLELATSRVQVGRDGGHGPEAAAREARYAAFAELLRPGETLVLAHHREDQAETMLLRLLRASGSDGLGAMRERRPFAAGTLWRPLLRVPRAALHAYARAQALDWIEDPSNADHGVDRNYLRHRVLPVLAERWPQAAQALARSAQLLAEDAELLHEGAGDRLARVRLATADSLSVVALLEFSPPWRARVLRHWLTGLALPPLPGAALAVIESDLLQGRPDAGAQYRWAGCALWRWRDLLHVEREHPPLPPHWRQHWSGAQPLRLPGGDSLSFEAVDGALPAEGDFLVASRQGGERITLPGRDHSHALKQCLQSAGVPPWQRERLPLLLAKDGELLAAGDVIVSARLAQFTSANGLRLCWHRVDAAGI